MKRLAVFTDGTWNVPTSHTNVVDLYGLLKGASSDGTAQLGYYHPGVGTAGMPGGSQPGLWQRIKDRFIGGAFGEGLSANVRDAYRFLVEHHDEGDEIFLFGFSRGAYTARSLSGVIIRCGLLKRDAGSALSVETLYARYRRGKDAVALYDLIDNRLPPGYELTEEDQALIAHSRRVPIRFVGVWDTVGALGVPWTEAPLIGRRNFYFHNTNLSVLTQNAYHALAIDENRAPYQPTLWTEFTPASSGAPPVAMPTKGPGGSAVEQRWFIGAHSNVGGGYPSDTLRFLPYAWLQAKAAALGLSFKSTVPLTGTEYRMQPVDSFAAFMGGWYRLSRLNRRFERAMGAGSRPVKGGWSTPINEWIDGSVLRRYQEFADYRPANLADWAKRRQADLTLVQGEQRAD